MKRAAPLALLPLVAGCLALPPENVTEAQLQAFDAAVASVGCTLETERQYLPVELQTGLPRDKVIEVAQYRMAQEQAVSLDNGGVRLVTGPCTPPEPAPEPAPAA